MNKKKRKAKREAAKAFRRQQRSFNSINKMFEDQKRLITNLGRAFRKSFKNFPQKRV